jgi:hypothetical protein
MIVRVNAQAAIEVFFYRHVLDKRVANKVFRHAVVKEIRNNAINWLAHDRKEADGRVEDGSDIHGDMLVDKAPDLSPLLRRQLTEFLFNLARRPHQQS